MIVGSEILTIILTLVAVLVSVRFLKKWDSDKQEVNTGEEQANAGKKQAETGEEQANTDKGQANARTTSLCQGENAKSDQEDPINYAAKGKDDIESQLRCI